MVEPLCKKVRKYCINTKVIVIKNICEMNYCYITVPAFTTIHVWSDVPDAIFVKAHAASNCISDLIHRK